MNGGASKKYNTVTRYKTIAVNIHLSKRDNCNVIKVYLSKIAYMYMSEFISRSVRPSSLLAQA